VSDNNGPVLENEALLAARRTNTRLFIRLAAEKLSPDYTVEQKAAMDRTKEKLDALNLMLYSLERDDQLSTSSFKQDFRSIALDIKTFMDWQEEIKRKKEGR
jgi:hypothetical protein